MEIRAWESIANMNSQERKSRRSFLRWSSGILVTPLIRLAAMARPAKDARPNLGHHGAPTGLALTDPSIIVTKSKRRLQLYSGGNLIKTYRVGLGLSPVEDK